MMKPRIPTSILACISILAFVFAACRFSDDQEPLPLFQATVNQDCAPWDGSAFTIMIPYDAASTIQVSIWDLSRTHRQATFSFPDETGRVGHAALHALSVETLSGSVSLGAVEEGIPFEGEFDLLTEAGRHLRGRFIANWGDFVALCG